MKLNASLAAALSLALAGCGGGRAHADYGPETASSQGSVASQNWGGGGGDPAYRQSASDQPISDSRTIEPVYQDRGRPGASYSAPGADTPRPQEYRAPQTAPQDSEADPAAGAAGPSGSSRQASARYDEVGFAGIRPVAGGGASDAAVVAVHRSLPVNSFAEVTALDSGKTILVLITGTLDPGNDHPIDLSAGAARQLGYDSPQTIAVRVRRITPTSSDQAALMQGRPATQRPDTPAVLLTALRKHLPANNYAAAAPAQPSQSRPTPPARPAATTRAPSGRGYFVQVAALSNARNAQSLAQSMGGFVKPGGGLHRVQIGPFATQAQAEAARRRAAGAGYKDARVFAN